ncbi:hypothetical protein [Marinitoga sp. 1137]|uniref:hypothetical protein n=1 Tax=Marinitoga sp. 1137 TaxID=1545835 RepID=UPI000952D6AE|nr:hypothetical protein [Marinitoga sp. 1137]
MPIFIPIIFAGMAVVSGRIGYTSIKKGYKNNNKAKKIKEQAENILEKINGEIERERNKVQKIIESFGHKKIEILSTSVNEFIINFEKIEGIDLDNINNMKEFDISNDYFNSLKKEFEELKIASFKAKDIAVNGIISIAGGTLSSYGLYSLVMSGLGGLATASTGTAIGTLSGAAATNATLAWFGGGSLASGGFGMIGGMTILGGLGTGVALGICGVVVEKKSEKTLNEAEKKYRKVEEFKLQSKEIIRTLNNIYTKTNQIIELLEKLNSYFIKYINSMKDILNKKGAIWSNYDLSEQNDIYVCIQLAHIIKSILDINLLKENGELNESIEEIIKNGNEYLKFMNNI